MRRLEGSKTGKSKPLLPIRIATANSAERQARNDCTAHQQAIRESTGRRFAAVSRPRFDAEIRRTFDLQKRERYHTMLSENCV